MSLKYISTLGFLYKIAFVTLMLSLSVACRKKINHEEGIHTNVNLPDESNNPTGGNGGSTPVNSWNKITSDEIVDVYTLEEFNGELYVGGIFEDNSGDVKEFAKLDASDNLIDPGFTGFFGLYGVYDLHTFNNELIIGGNFTYYNLGAYPEDLVRMNTAGVILDIPFTESIGHSVRNISTYNGNILLCGDFQNNGTNAVTTNNVELLNNYTTIGMADLSGTIFGSAEFDNSLYVCGPDDKLQAWNGSNWNQINYINEYWSDDVYDVCVYDGHLYMLGSFNGGITLKKMDTNNNWENITEVGQIGTMTAYGGMKVIDNELYVFDGNLNINNGASTGIIKFNGTSWSNVGTMNDDVHDVIKFNGNLYIATEYGIYKSN